jgi:hypothetical protein
MPFDHYLRLEPRQPNYDLDRGIQAEIGDPLWFLGRQWQMGEHQGEDAGSPVRIEAWVARRLLDLQGGDPGWDSQIVPPEAIIESEPGDWWTIGRRLRYGVRFRALVNIEALPAECFLRRPAKGSREYGTDLPAPYEEFSGGTEDREFLDGWSLWQRRVELGIPETSFPEIPASEPEDMWLSDQFAYHAQFSCNGHTLRVGRHGGGDIDWYSADGDVPFAPRVLEEGHEPEISGFPQQLTYPGVPNTRFWQIEDSKVDIGGYPPDTGHFPSMLLADLLSLHGTEWFLFPITSHAGHAVTIERVVVTDSFGERYDSREVENLRPPEDWSLFAVKGMGANTLLVWPTAITPLSGIPLEEVLLGVDEYSNLLWAVERRVNSRDIRTPSLQERQGRLAQPDQGFIDIPKDDYLYLPATDALPYWHPYQMEDTSQERHFLQARLVDYTAERVRLMEPEPMAQVLNDPTAEAGEPRHVISPAAIPANGILIERRWRLARDVNGLPVLWVQRQRKPLLAPPARQLRFDIMQGGEKL